MKTRIWLLSLVLFLQGCSQCVSEEWITDTVTVTGTKYQDGWTQYVSTEYTTSITFYPATYSVSVEYKGKTYTIINNRDLYDKYNSLSLPQSAKAHILVKTYIDNEIRYTIYTVE